LSEYFGVGQAAGQQFKQGGAVDAGGVGKDEGL
jgi:hypothetical protein